MNDNTGRIVPGALPYAHLTRQLDLLPVEKLDVLITVIGCGAIGSFTVLALAKMGFWNFTLYDHDEVDVVNLSSQFFRYTDLGKNKATALASLVEDFTREKVVAKPERWKGQPLSGLVILSVDNMATRKKVADAVLGKNPQVSLIVDPRMGAETALCFVARPMETHSATRYANSLYDDATAVQEPCTAKATMYTVLGIASHVAACVRDFAVGRPVPHSMTWDMRAYDHSAFSDAREASD